MHIQATKNIHSYLNWHNAIKGQGRWVKLYRLEPRLDDPDMINTNTFYDRIFSSINFKYFLYYLLGFPGKPLHWHQYAYQAAFHLFQRQYQIPKMKIVQVFHYSFFLCLVKIPCGKNTTKQIDNDRFLYFNCLHITSLFQVHV